MDSEDEVVRILIADDHPIFRHGLRVLFEADPGFRVVGEATDGEEVVSLVRQLDPDILLLDLAMPRKSGFDVLRELASSSSATRTVVLTAAIDKAAIVQALQLGARGVVLKESAAQLLFKCIRTVMGGQYWIGREGVSGLIQALRNLLPSPGAGIRRKDFGLTPRESEVVEAVVAGYSNKDIAQKFSLSEQTIKHHITNIFDKLGVSNRLELALFAINHRLIDER